MNIYGLCSVFQWEETMYDVIIIGSGVVGALHARELSRYPLRVLVLEKNNDVSMEATLANSAVVHSGHDPKPGSLKAKFNVLGNRMYRQLSKELHVPILECGGLVVATSSEEEAVLDELFVRAGLNGLLPDEYQMLTREEALMLEPNLSDQVTKALSLPTTAVTFPWEMAIAGLENAINNGVEVRLNHEVTQIERSDNGFILHAGGELFETKVIINSAGVYSAKISEMVHPKFFTITPRRGEYFVTDNRFPIVKTVVYPAPGKKGKGILATPMVHGNTLLGPTSNVVGFEDQHRTTPEGLKEVKDNITKTIKHVPFDKIIRSFAGSRPTGDAGDFIIEETSPGFVNLGGIESPGLTAAPAIASYVVEEFVIPRFSVQQKPHFDPTRRERVKMQELSIQERNEYIQKDPKYGKIICRCETVTEAEILDAIHRPVGAHSMVGTKLRTRAGAGRCQGAFCSLEVLKILSRELKIDPIEVEYKHKGSFVLAAKTKGAV
jgi:glycerol-3-phosphate dehydrogenase